MPNGSGEALRVECGPNFDTKVAVGEIATFAQLSACDLAQRFGDDAAFSGAQEALEELQGLFESTDLYGLGIAGTARPTRGCSCVTVQGFKLHGYSSADDIPSPPPKP